MKKKKEEHDCLMEVLRLEHSIVMQLVPGATIMNEKRGISVTNEGTTIVYLLDVANEPK